MPIPKYLPENFYIIVFHDFTLNYMTINLCQNVASIYILSD